MQATKTIKAAEEITTDIHHLWKAALKSYIAARPAAVVEYDTTVGTGRAPPMAKSE